MPAICRRPWTQHRLLEGLDDGERGALDGLLRKFLAEFE
jgi:hypothetical protein